MVDQSLTLLSNVEVKENDDNLRALLGGNDLRGRTGGQLKVTNQVLASAQ